MQRRVRLRATEPEENFWPSFTDMISTIALILFFLILIIFVKNIIIADELSASQSTLDAKKLELIEMQESMAVLNAEITEKETNLMMLQDEAENLKAEVEQGEIALRLSEEQIVDQQKIIAQSNKELGDMRTQIQELAVIRLSILKEIKETIEDELVKAGIEGGDQVIIGENGNIILNNTLLFRSDSSTINEDGKVLLDELAQVFENILDDKTIRNYIDAIQIEGHTDSVNTTEYNRTLSTDRANSVVNYLFDANDRLEDKYGAYFVASGYSELRPLVEGDSEEAKAQNRRIEVSIILKDSNIQDIIDEYLENLTEVE